MDENQKEDESAETTKEGRALSFFDVVNGLIARHESTNIAEDLPNEILTQLGEQVARDTETDDNSRKDWLNRATEAMDAALQITEEKTFPWKDAANVKYPVLTTAALQFHARAYGAIIPGKQIVKGAITGADQDGQKDASANRIGQHMSYQLLEESPEWVEDMDRMMLAMPIEGHAFKKTYFDPSLGRNVSEWIRPIDFIVNNATKSLDTTPRATHRLRVFPYQIKERMRAGIYKEYDNLFSTDDDEKEEQQELYEQHLLYDSDNDGIKEPWIVTVHKDSKKVLRIVAGYEPDSIMVNSQGKVIPLTKLDPQLIKQAKLVKIDREQYFTSFPFLPSPDGGFYAVGFGQLVGPLTSVIDTLTNQILDAATRQNNGGGFYDKKAFKGPKGNMHFEPGEYKPIDAPTGGRIQDAFIDLPGNGPSQVTFSLLEMLLAAVKDVTATKDILTGEVHGETATTTMAAIEQGLKVYTSIYGRIYRSLKKEFKRWYRLNGIYLQPESYYTVMDTGEQQQVFQRDYQGDGTDVQPVADPSASTTMQKMARAQFAMQLAGGGNPHVNLGAATKMVLEAAEVPLTVFVEQPPQQQDPRMEAEANLKQAQAEKTLAEALLVIKNMELVTANALKALAEAEAKATGTQLGIYKAQLDHFNAGREEINGQGGNRGMEAPSGDGMVSQEAQGLPPELLGGAGEMLSGGQPLQDPNLDGAQLGQA